MISTFAGLEMSKRALNAYRLALQTAGHNVSNVKTEGYSRQRVNLSTTTPYSSPGVSSPVIPGQVGTGVKVDEIVRIRDEFLDFQYRSEMADSGYWQKVNSMYETVQLYLAEPSGEGVRVALDTFWGSVQELAKSPDSAPIRRSVVEAAKSLGSMLDTIVKGYDQYSSMVNDEVKSTVEEMNGILHDIASLNQEIYAVQATNQNPNDLLDKRDLLLDKLSGMIDIEIQEPYKNGDITGEFFLTLNGRTLVQGDKVRELVAHAFTWENKTYYDVQVTDNEFDIVENPEVALALATGPEGVHQLNVYRLANGEEWGVGGEDPLCLTKNGTLKTILTSEPFPGGIVGTSLEFNVSSGDYEVDFDLSWTGGTWTAAYTVTDNGEDPPVTTTGTINYAGADNVNSLAEVMKKVFNDNDIPVSATSNGTTLTVTSDDDSVFIDGLTMTTSYVQMRTRPATTTEKLGLASSFRIQVGTQGTQVASKVFRTPSNPDLADGDILGTGHGTGRTSESYTFRVGANDYQLDVTVKWNSTAGRWDITSDTGVSMQSLSANGHLTATDMKTFLESALPKTGDNSFAVGLGTPPTQFSIASTGHYLISVSDVSGDLAARMGMVNPNPVITIDVTEDDSLETIRNKINEKYQEAYGLTEPEQWVHASLAQDADQSWYLTINSNVPGEAQRITLMGDEDGNMQTLLRLGLVKLDPPAGTPPDATRTYREVTAYNTVAEDAYFTFDGVSYLSADNKFDQARRIPAGTNRNDYSASKLETVSEGIFLELRSVGRTSITVRHHVQGGSVKALEEIRDGMMPQLKAELDEITWSLVNSFNAYQYSGYGIGENINTTGVEFFEKLRFKSGSGSLLEVYDAVNDDVSLIGAATGKLGEDGKAVYGTTAGSGSGDNAARIAALQTDKLLENGTASFGDFYESYLAKIGSEAGRAALMNKTQKNLVDQINAQRQSVMGVNIDEEMLDILMFNHAFSGMSRYATTIDEMLDRIINGFGLVGR